MLLSSETDCNVFNIYVRDRELCDSAVGVCVEYMRKVFGLHI